jgi:hypothetical protein
MSAPNSSLDFIIGGAPRSGTTFLATALDLHPDIWMLKPYVPEPKIFNLPPEKSSVAYQEEIASRLRDRPVGKLAGEKTSGYFSSEIALRRIVATLPAVKMVFILREPVERAYSNYLWSRKNGLEKLSFAEACDCEDTRPDPLPPEKAYVRPYDYLSRGRYGTYARRWVEAVGRERVLFLQYEQLAVSPERLLVRLEDFLGVRRWPLPAADLGRINVSDPAAEPLPPELRARLRQFFADEVESFAKLTGEDISLWKY